MQPPTLQDIIERAEREGRSSVNISTARLKVLLESEALLPVLAQQTGIIESDPRLAWS